MTDSPQSCVTIIGTGSYLPEKILTNFDLEKMVDTSDEWIVSRTGIKERRLSAEGEHCSHMAAVASQRALENAGVSAEDIDLIVLGTCTADKSFPSSACLVQNIIGAHNAFSMDVNAACSGFLYSMEVARNFLRCGPYRTALVIGSEELSSILNWNDRNTCVLFGDGAGAAVLQTTDRGGILSTRLGSDGTLHHLLQVGQAEAPGSESGGEAGSQDTIIMAGREVFKHAVNNMSQAFVGLLGEVGMTADQIALVVPHQANVRILAAIKQKLNLPDQSVFVNVEKYGNTSAASVIIALDEASRQGLLKPGDHIMLVAFGAGFTWGTTILEWTKS